MIQISIKMRLEYQDSIDGYLLNRMSEEERISFEEKCANNSELKEQLEHTRDVRRVITERNKILTRIQELEEEYEREKRASAHKKIVTLSWVSGIAAVFVMGYFLFAPSNVASPESSGRLISMNTNNENPIVDSVAIRSEKDQEENEQLLAKNEPEKKDNKVNVIRIDDEQVLGFGKGVVVTVDSNMTGTNDKELEKVLEDKSEVSKKLSELEQERASGEIDEVIYETTISLLKHQWNHLCWRESIILLSMNRKEEAMTILNELRKVEGQFQHRADSLYNELRK